MKATPGSSGLACGMLRRPFIALSVSVLIASVCGSTLVASPGVVQTRSGRVIEGDIRLDADGSIAVARADGTAVMKVPLEELKLAKLGPGASAKSLAAFTAPNTNDLSTPALKPLPAPWRQATIGSPRTPGTSGQSGETVVLRAAGTNLWSGGRDEGHFVYQTLGGDGSIVVRLDRSDARSAGIMVRKDLKPEAEFVLLAMEGPGGRDGVTYCTRRSAEFREKFHTEGDRQHRDDARVPIWLRIDREGKKFTGYISRDDRGRWEFLATSHGRQAETVHVGLFVCGGDANTVREAAFSKLALSAGKGVRTENRFGEFARFNTTTNPTSEASFQPQVVLRNGTVLVGKIIAIDPSGVRQMALGQEQFFSSVQVARVLLRSVPLQSASLLAPDRPGVLLSSGDFIEGEITAVKNNSLTLNSVLLGQRRIDLGDKVIAVVWNDPKPAPGAFLVRLRDGSLLRAGRLDAEGQSIVAQEVLPVAPKIPLANILEIQRE